MNTNTIFRGHCPTGLFERLPIWFLPCLLLLLISTTSCSLVNTAKIQSFLGIEQNLISVAYKLAEGLEQRATPSLIPYNPDAPILTTTFVSNNDLKKTSRFSRILQEHLTSRFVQMGYSVREIKLRQQLEIKEQEGELMLSRNLREIKASQSAQAVSVGTYSLTNNSIYISARLVDPSNGTIISSIDRSLPLDRHMMALFGLHPQKQELMNPIEEPSPSIMTRLLY